MTQDDIVLIVFIGGWLFFALGWFTFSNWFLTRFFPHDASLSDDSTTDADSSSADRRDTF